MTKKQFDSKSVQTSDLQTSELKRHVVDLDAAFAKLLAQVAVEEFPLKPADGVLRAALDGRVVKALPQVALVALRARLPRLQRVITKVPVRVNHLVADVAHLRVACE